MNWMSASAAVLIDLSVRITILAAVVALALVVFRVKSPRARHTAWLGVLLAMLAMPVLRAALPSVPVPVPAAWFGSAASDPAVSGPVVLGDGPGVAGPISEASATVSPADASRVPGWMVALAVIYLAGVVLSAWRVVRGWRATRTVLGGARPVDLTSDPRADAVFETDAVHSPMTVGLLRPRIVLPVAWRAWHVEQLDAVLAHERAHVVRRDPLVAFLAQVNLAVFWFHPLAWWMRRTLAAHAEEACDDAGVAAMGERQAYAEVLVTFADAVQQHGTRVSWHGAGVAGHGSLVRRIERVLHADPAPRMSRRRAAVATACCVAATAVVAAATGEVPAPAASRSAIGVAAPATAQGAPAAGTSSPLTPVDPAQAATISGTVTDPTGLVMPGVAVELTLAGVAPSETGAMRLSTTTDAAGRFSFGGLRPETYQLQLSMAAFKTLTRAKLQVEPGGRADETLAMELGGMTETISIGRGFVPPVGPQVPGDLTEQLATMPEQPGPYEALARAYYGQGFFGEAAAANAAAARLRALQASSATLPAASGGNVVAPLQIRWVSPTYPAASSGGIVILQATIDTDGLMHDIRVLRSVPGLDDVSVEAVRQWRYAPTLLNGTAVPVTATVTMHFEP